MAQNQGSRMTRQRRVILEELRKSVEHPSADELYNIVRKHLPHVSLGTVYRNLDVLAEAGMIRKLESGTIRRFDGNTSAHDHVRCLGCGKVADVPSPGPKIDHADEIDVPGFRITAARLEYEGWCMDCLPKP